jgi:hypothetical protein
MDLQGSKFGKQRIGGLLRMQLSRDEELPPVLYGVDYT